MSNPYAQFLTDNDLEAGAGVDLQYSGFSIKIHRAGGANKKYKQVLDQKMAPHRLAFDQGTIEEEVAKRVLVETYAEAIIIGWKGVTDRSGKIMKYSTSNCVKLLTDLPELFKDIQKQANSLSVFLDQGEELDIKN